MKKVLSWVLALALVLSSFAISFAGDTENASKLKDANQITYTEAVDVMVATGVIAGYPDGYYYPAKAVKRAEMAKMIAVLVNGGEDVGDYYKDACKFADSKNHWAAGYIAYCANEGIIDGRDANTFDPEANVTVTEVAKMLLVALGYDSKIEGYANNANWAGNILKRAKANDFFDGIEKLDTGAVANREIAAQIIFNAMQAEMVEYIFDAEIIVGDTTVSVNTKVVGTDEALYADAFDGDLVRADAKADGFGRPAHTWTYDKDKVGTYADTADYKFVVTDDDSVEAALKAYDEDLYDEFVGSDADKEITSYAMNGDEGVDEVYLGDVVELFDLDTTTKEGLDSYKAVIVYYELVTIDEVDTDVTDKDAKDGVSAYVTIEGETYDDTDVAGFDAKTYVDDAVIAVAYDYGEDDGTILDTYIPEKVTGELTKFYENSTYIDGTKYNNGTEWDALGLTIGNEYDFYFINDYLYHAVEVKDNSPYSYAVVIGSKFDAGYTKDDGVITLKLFTAKGKTEIFTLNNDAIDDGDVAYCQGNDLIAYTLNDDNEIDFLAVANAAGFDKEMKANGILNGKKVSEDVVAFFYDGDDWSASDYADLEAAETVDAATYMMDRDSEEMAAILLNSALEETTDDVYGFITDVVNGINADKDYIYSVTALIDGKEVTLDTTEDVEIPQGGPFTLFKFTVNEDDVIEGIAVAKCFAVNEMSDDFEDLEVAFMTNKTLSGPDYTFDEEDILFVTEKSGNLLDVGAEVEGVHNKDFQSVDGAAFYQINEDGELEIAALRDVKKGYAVALFQTDEDASAWNIVVFVDPAIGQIQ